MAKKKYPDMGGHKIGTLNDITLEVIADDIMGRTDEDKRWLRQMLTEEIMKESGKKAKRTTFEVRKAFLKQYYPEYAPKDNIKKKVTKDILARLNAALGE